MHEKPDIKIIKRLSKKSMILSDHTRIRILDLLREHNELNVLQVCEKLNTKQAATLTELRILFECKLVTRRCDKKRLYYSIDTEKVNNIIALIEKLNDNDT